MKNLKRALSLALASVMVLGMMVVGAGAVEFNDADEIVNTEAVNTLVALGILKGKDTGDFDPEGIVTRAEMTKMICVALNGGKDPNLVGGGKYPDTKNHWAGGYIDYCSAQGIVSGDTAGNFNPDKTITGTEAAKMILIALGFSAENEKFVNDAAWATNINVRASQKDLYADIAVIPDQGLTRDSAAQMLWNGLNANMVKYDYQLNTVDGNLTSVAIAEDKLVGGLTVTILNDKFKMITQEGYLAAISYNSTKKEYTYTVLDDGIAITTTPVAANSASVASKADHTALYGDAVKMLYKPTSNGPELFGIYSNSDSTLTAAYGDLDVTLTNDNFKVDGTKYKVETATVNALPVYFGDATETNGSTIALKADLTPATALKFVDVDGNGKFDYAIANEATVGKVSFAGTATVTIGSASYDIEDDIAEIYEDIAKNDYAIVTLNDFTDLYTITKADTISGKITAVKDDSTINVDGTWYKSAVAGSALAASNIGSTYELAVVGGYYYSNSLTFEAGSTADVLFVSAVDPVTDTLGTKTAKAKAYFTDGSSQTIVVNKLDDANLTKSVKLDDDTTTALVTATGDDYLDAGIVVAGAMYRYTKNSDGNYKLYTLQDTNDVTKAGYKAYAQDDATGTAAKFVAATDKVLIGTTNFTVADDSIFFVQTSTAGSRDVKVLTGKALKNWSADFGAAGQILANTVNGFNTAKIGALVSKTATGISGAVTSEFGFITAAPYLTTNADDDKCISVNVWNGEEDVTLNVTHFATGYNGTTGATDVSTSIPGHIAKGKFIAYEIDNDGNAVKVRPAGTEYAVSALSGNDVEFKVGTSPAIAATLKNDDIKYIYVNTADAKGVEGGELQLANETAISGVYVKNVVAQDTTTTQGVSPAGTVAVVFVDVGNNLDSNAGLATFTAKTTVTAFNTTTKVLTVTANTAAATVATEAAAAFGAMAAYLNDTNNDSNSDAGETVTIVAFDGTTVTYVTD